MDFAVRILEDLNEKFGVDLVVTQPDKPVGRKQELRGTPVKNRAVELGIETFQPKNIKKDYQKIIETDFDFIIVAAYGQIIPEVVLDHAKHRAINVHASLLPRYRGGSPMHKAIINGDRATGVSIMYMVKEMDAGPVLKQEEVEITLTDNVKTLEMKLADLGSKLLIETMKELINYSSDAIPQDESRATYAYNIKPEERVIDFNQTALDCYNLVRGLYPWPIAVMDIHGMKMKVYKALFSDENVSDVVGEIVRINKEGVFIQTKDGLFILKEVQLQGKNRMGINAFMNGLGKDILTLGRTI